MSFLKYKKYWLSSGLIKDQISSLSGALKLVKFLIKEKSGSKDAWDNDLMVVLCEYFTYVHQMLQFLEDIAATTPEHNPQTQVEEYLIGEAQGMYLKSHANLLKILRMDLEHKHDISLTIH